ncbi:MAG TPA: hypothetical protein DIW80_10080 [Gordonia polyisoprenivorans]|nr:hypothetical protein B1964_10935 [Gordonia sp. i37]HCS57525.1 hypothetical protein [Gordonia polyisoprenivorans]
MNHAVVASGPGSDETPVVGTKPSERSRGIRAALYCVMGNTKRDRGARGVGVDVRTHDHRESAYDRDHRTDQ